MVVYWFYDQGTDDLAELRRLILGTRKKLERSRSELDGIDVVGMAQASL